MKIPISRFPGKVKKTTRESDILIGTSHQESVIGSFLLVISQIENPNNYNGKCYIE
jgi:hypothetical protein